MASRDLLVRIIGDSRDVEQAFARSSKAANRFGADVTTTGEKLDKTTRSFKGFAAGAGAGFGGALFASEAIHQLDAAIDVASNLNEQISRTNVVFGSSAGEIEKWAETTAFSIGIANDQALEAAATFGAMFDQAGQSSSDAARLSKSVVQLASDLSSFTNLPIDDSLTALRSGLSGEIEPLRRFQVFLTEAAVAQEAMAQTGKSSAKELTQGEKIMARWNLILKQTTKQQGDFARTSDGLANSQKSLSAQTRDLQGEVGSALLPVMESFTGVLLTVTTQALAVADALKAIANIKIPTITIPFTTKKVGGGTFGGTAGKGIGIGLLGFISPAGLFAVGVKELVDQIRGEPPPDTKSAADAFDASFDTFIESLERDINGSVDRANAKIKAKFGEPGWKPLEVNELGESLQRMFDDTMEALDLQFDQAVFAGNSQEALAVLDEIEAAIRERIKSEGRTTELLRLLFNVEQERARILKANAAAAKASKDAASELAREQAEAANAAREAAREKEQARQFRALGLSPEGDKPIPTIKNLTKQIDQLGKKDLSRADRRVLATIRKVLVDPLKKATPETRAAAKGLIDAIRDGLDPKEITGPLTKTTGLNTKKILAGLGLSPEAEREIRQRLSGFNSAGMGNAGAANRPTGSFVGPGQQPITVNTTVVLDDQVVGKSVTRTQQKNDRRNPKAKRGPRSGI